MTEPAAARSVGVREEGMPRASGGEAARLVVRALYDAYYGRLAGWTAKLLGDTALGHDFATEAFARLLRDFETVEEPQAWLYTVAANLVRDHWRKKGREQAAYQRVGHDVDGSWPAADPATVITVRDVVLALPERLRVAVMLTYYADLPVTVVAARLGKSEGAVKRDLLIGGPGGWRRGWRACMMHTHSRHGPGGRVLRPATRGRADSGCG